MDCEEHKSIELLFACSKNILHQAYDNVVAKQRIHGCQNSKLKSDVCSIGYLAVNEGLFTQILTNKKEKFTKGNH